MPPDRALIFLHVLKSGGTTLAGVLQRHYPPDSVHYAESGKLDVTDQEAARIRLLQGHVPFGAHERLPIPADYITILRDPVDRLASLYHYLRRRPPGHPLHDAAQRLPLHEFVRERETQNDQARMLSGRPGDFTASTLDDAKRHLNDRFVWVGLTDRFDESLLLLRHRLGWRDVWYRRENVTAGRPATESIDPALRELIGELNPLDVQLVDLVRTQLDEQLARQPPSFQRELARFRRTNRVYQAVATAARPVRRSIPAPLKSNFERRLRAVRAR